MHLVISDQRQLAKLPVMSNYVAKTIAMQPLLTYLRAQCGIASWTVELADAGILSTPLSSVANYVELRHTCIV